MKLLDYTNNCLSMIIKNKYFTYLTSGLLIAYIGLISHQDNKTIYNLKQSISKPKTLILVILFQIILSFYNMPVAALLALSTIATLVCQPNAEEIKAKDNRTNDNTQVSHRVTDNVVDNNEGLVEGFKDNSRHFKNDFINKRVGKYTNDLEEGIDENKKRKRSKQMDTINKSNANHDKNSNIGKIGNNKQKLTIQKRIFDIETKEGKNLLNTREICKDIINRINYEYEDADYLKKYIASRVEEIVDINNLLDDEED